MRALAQALALPSFPRAASFALGLLIVSLAGAARGEVRASENSVDAGHAAEAPDAGSFEPEAQPTEPDPNARFRTVVTATRAPESASEAVIAGPLLDTFPARSGDDLLRSVPGLLVTRHGTEGKATQLFLRGFDAVHGADLEVTLEGIPLNELSNVHGQGYLDLGFLLRDAVRRVSVIKGPFRAEQGPFATAGSVRFDLGVPSDGPQSRVGYEFGSTQRHRISGVHGEADSVLAAEALVDRGFGENRSLRRVGVLGGWRIPTGALPFRLRMIGAVYGASFGSPGVVPLEDVEAGRLGFYDVYAKGLGSESLRALLGARLTAFTSLGKLEALAWGQARSLTLQENFTGFLLDPRGDTRRQEHHAAGGGVRATLSKRVGPLGLEAGLAASMEHVSQQEELLDQSFAPYARPRAHGFWQRPGSLWLSGRANPLEQLQLELGGRLELFHFEVASLTAPEQRGSELYAQVLPRLQLSWFASPTLTVFASAGQGVRPPEARAVLTSAASTSDQDVAHQLSPATPTRADSLELGARYDTAPLSLSTALFGTEIEREQIFDHLAGVNLERNATRRLGAELVAAWRPVPTVELRADLTFVNARFVDSGAPVPGAPTLLGGLTGGFVHPNGVSLGAHLLLLGARPLANGAQAAPAVILDVTAGYRWKQLELSLQLENATDFPWREGEFHYASWFDRSRPRSSLPKLHFSAGPPRNVRLGLAYHFR